MIHPFKGVRPYSKKQFNCVEKLNKVLFDISQSVDNFELIYDFIENNQNQFIQENEFCYYVYRLESQYGCQTGLIALVDLNNTSCIIHPHEEIKQGKSELYLNLMNTKKIQANPIILLHHFLEPIQELLNKLTETKPSVNLKTVAGCDHKLWIIENPDLINMINDNYRFINNYYIADGHHRYYAAKESIYGKSKSYLLSWLVSDNQAYILPCHWIIPSLGLDKKTFFKEIEHEFEISIQFGAVQPKTFNELGLYIDNTWYLLQMKQLNKLQPISIYMKQFLNQKFAINSVISTSVDVHKLMANVNNSMHDLAFSFPEINIADLLSCISSGHILPANTTYFVPKPAIGLISYCSDSSFAKKYQKKNLQFV